MLSFINSTLFLGEHDCSQRHWETDLHSHSFISPLKDSLQIYSQFASAGLQRCHNQEPQCIYYTKRPALKSNSPWPGVYVNINDPWICIFPPHSAAFMALFIQIRKFFWFSITHDQVLPTDCIHNHASNISFKLLRKLLKLKEKKKGLIEI